MATTAGSADWFRTRTAAVVAANYGHPALVTRIAAIEATRWISGGGTAGSMLVEQLAQAMAASFIAGRVDAATAAALHEALPSVWHVSLAVVAGHDLLAMAVDLTHPGPKNLCLLPVGRTVAGRCLRSNELCQDACDAASLATRLDLEAVQSQHGCTSLLCLPIAALGMAAAGAVSTEGAASAQADTTHLLHIPFGCIGVANKSQPAISGTELATLRSLAAALGPALAPQAPARMVELGALFPQPLPERCACYACSMRRCRSAPLAAGLPRGPTTRRVHSGPGAVQPPAAVAPAAVDPAPPPSE